MSDVLGNQLAVLVLAVAVIGAATALGMRQPPPKRTGAPRGVGPMAAFVTWGGVLVAVALAARGKLVIAAIALVATMVHGGVVRARMSRS